MDASLNVADTRALEAIIAPVVDAAGLSLVRIAMLGTPSGPTLQVMAEDPASRQLTIEQCARLSRRISEVLDVADPIPDEYQLEVSSPGIDRPLTRPQDFDDWAGHAAKLQMAAPIEGRKRFQGRLLGRDGDKVRMAIEGFGEVALPLADIASAKLVLTDELIKATGPIRATGPGDIIEEEDE